MSHAYCQNLKANSSRWMVEQGIEFAWQKGYGAFSVSSSHAEDVIQYVRNQKAHHMKRSFEDEFHRLSEEVQGRFTIYDMSSDECRASGAREFALSLPTAGAVG